VFGVTAYRGWHVADLVIEVDDVQCELIRPGRAVSIDARSIRRDDDHDLHIRRHRLAVLDAVAVLANGERPWYVGAEIVSVREAPASTPPVSLRCVEQSRCGRVADQAQPATRRVPPETSPKILTVSVLHATPLAWWSLTWEPGR
jgi:hypothetical protein